MGKEGGGERERVNVVNIKYHLLYMTKLDLNYKEKRYIEIKIDIFSDLLWPKGNQY